MKWMFAPVVSIIIFSLTKTYIYVSIFLLFMIMLIIICYFLNYLKSFEYYVMKKDVYFEYLDCRYKYNYQVNAVSLINKLRTFYGRHTFNPDKGKIECILPRNSTIRYLKRDDTQYKYNIEFCQDYNFGQKFTVKIETDINEELQFPLFSSTIIKPTKYQEITIKIPLRLLKNKYIRKKIIPFPSEVGVTTCEEDVLDADGSYTWKIPNPKLKYEYCIEWNFIDEKLAEINEF